MSKLPLKLEAVKMRESGASIKAISKLLSVSTSTVSLWCRNLELSSEIRQKLLDNSKNPYFAKRREYLSLLQKIKEERVRIIQSEAKEVISKLTSREKLLVGLALYWAEGFKKDRMVGFSNSDYKMIRLVIFWLRDCLGVSDENLRYRIVINESHIYRYQDILNYWVDRLNLSEKSFYKPTYQKVKWKKVYSNPEDYFGILRIRVLKSTDLLRRIMAMISSISS